MKLYWAWRGKEDTTTLPPTKKRLDYTTLRKDSPYEMKLCIGVWDDEKYTLLNRNELERLCK